ncbi:hypothetical protein AKJ16_DCAP08471 [Drosera capensis]
MLAIDDGRWSGMWSSVDGRQSMAARGGDGRAVAEGQRSAATVGGKRSTVNDRASVVVGHRRSKFIDRWLTVGKVLSTLDVGRKEAIWEIQEKEGVALHEGKESCKMLGSQG